MNQVEDNQSRVTTTDSRTMEQAGRDAEIAAEIGTAAVAGTAGMSESEGEKTGRWVSRARGANEAAPGLSIPRSIPRSMERGIVPALGAGTGVEVELRSPALETEDTWESRVVGEVGPGREPGREPGGDRVLLDDRGRDLRMASERERLAFRYVMGMERGDDEMIGAVIERALDDDQLWEIIEGINLEYQREEGLI